MNKRAGLLNKVISSSSYLHGASRLVTAASGYGWTRALSLTLPSILFELLVAVS